jgi:hypothetical protein
LKEVAMSKDDAYGDSAIKMSRWLPFLDEAMEGLQAKMDRQKGDGGPGAGEEEAQVALDAAVSPPAPAEAPPPTAEMGGPGWDDDFDFGAWADGLDAAGSPPAAPVAEPPPDEGDDDWLGGGEEEAAAAAPDEEDDWLGAMDGDDWPGGGEDTAAKTPDEGGAGGGEDWLAEIGG